MIIERDETIAVCPMCGNTEFEVSTIATLRYDRFHEIQTDKTYRIYRCTECDSIISKKLMPMK
jgi:predicted nucleic-acid-binding Zn-ribbon protein